MFSLYLSDRLVQFIRNVRRRWTLSVTDTFLEWFLHRKKQIETIYFLFYWRQTKYLTYPFYLCLNPLLLCPSMIKDVGCLTHQDLNKKTNQQKVYYIRFKFSKQRWISQQIYIIPFMLVASNNDN